MILLCEGGVDFSPFPPRFSNCGVVFQVGGGGKSGWFLLRGIIV